MTHLCSPPRETESITYSFPLRNSCTRMPAPCAPNLRSSPESLMKCSCASSNVLQSFTPSEPADSTGLTITGISSVTANSFTSSQVVPPASRTARTPVAPTASCCSFLLRRESESFVPLVRRPSASEILSATLTPDSQPQMTAISVVPNVAPWSALRVSESSACSSTSFVNLRCERTHIGTCERKSGGRSRVQSAMTAYPRS
mmetsp:Transcript_10719/g.27087  ORF Transcript_10719/g.27087 Transcript_10719/m.27087 type:complete len:202 (-) Transcript_10719:118-723(-)